MLKPIFAEQADRDETGTPADALALGLDILECLAASQTPKTVSEIAREMKVERLRLSCAVNTLEKLGYLASTGDAGAYVATPRLYELGIHAPFIQALIDRANPVMQGLSDEILQSCNLAMPFGRHLCVVLQTESPGALSINVPEGFRYENPASAPAAACYAQTLTPVQAHGVLEGVIDLSCPIFDGGSVTAVLTIPYIKTIESVPLERCMQALQRAAMALSDGQIHAAPRLTVLYG